MNRRPYSPQRTGDPVIDRNFDAIAAALGGVSGSGTTSVEFNTINVRPGYVPTSQASFVHTPFTTGVVRSGLLATPAGNDLLVTVASGNDLKWIGRRDLLPGDKITIHFLDPIILQHMAADAPDFAAPLFLAEIDLTGERVDWYSHGQYGAIAAFQLRTDASSSNNPCWRLLWLKEGEGA